MFHTLSTLKQAYFQRYFMYNCYSLPPPQWTPCMESTLWTLKLTTTSKYKKVANPCHTPSKAAATFLSPYFPSSWQNLMLVQECKNLPKI
jgi:hypothetical protein